MGSKFCNLNIYKLSSDSIVDFCPKYKFYQSSPDWTTVTSPLLQWGDAQEHAKHITKRLGCIVLCTEYYDDSFVEFSLFAQGELITTHIPASYENLKRKKGNSKAFVAYFRLNREQEISLNNMLLEKNCEESVKLLESILGCPIFGVDYGVPPELYDNRKMSDIRESKIEFSIYKNSSAKSKPPYTANDMGDKRVVFPDESTNPFKESLRTVICYTDNCDPVINYLRLYVRQARQESTQSNTEATVNVLLGRNLIAFQGMHLNPRIYAREFSSEFKCLVAMCGLTLYTDVTKNESNLRILGCGIANKNRLICYGQRGWGQSARNTIMPDIELRSPHFVLQRGQLLSAFEEPEYWNAVNGLGSLLGCSLYPIDKVYAHLVSEEEGIEIFGV